MNDLEDNSKPPLTPGRFFALGRVYDSSISSFSRLVADYYIWTFTFLIRTDA